MQTNLLYAKKNEGITIIDNIIINHFSSNLPSPVYLLVYIDGLSRCFGDYNETFVSNSTLAKKYGVSEKTISNIWAYWEKVGLIRRIPRFCKVRFPKTREENMDYREKAEGEYKYQCSNIIRFIKNLSEAIEKGEFDLDSALAIQQSMKAKKEEGYGKNHKKTCDDNPSLISLDIVKANCTTGDKISQDITANDFYGESISKDISTEGGEIYISTPHDTEKASSEGNKNIDCEPDFGGGGYAHFTPGGEMYVSTPIYNKNNIYNKYKRDNKPKEIITTTYNEDGNISKSDSDTVEEINGLEEIKHQVENTIGAPFSKFLLEKLIRKKGVDNIRKYLESWDLFSNQNIRNVSGFFYSAVMNEYITPVSKTISSSARPFIPGLASFEQRQYDKDYFESLYEAV